MRAGHKKLRAEVKFSGDDLFEIIKRVKLTIDGQEQQLEWQANPGDVYQVELESFPWQKTPNNQPYKLKVELASKELPQTTVNTLSREIVFAPPEPRPVLKAELPNPRIVSPSLLTGLYSLKLTPNRSEWMLV